MKYVAAGVWLLIALLCSSHTGARRICAYAGVIIALVHVCALGIGMVDSRWNKHSMQGGEPPVGGFIVGIGVGVILGCLAGGVVSRNIVLFWLVQAAVAGFLIFLPLVRL